VDDKIAVHGDVEVGKLKETYGDDIVLIETTQPFSTNNSYVHQVIGGGMERFKYTISVTLPERSASFVHSVIVTRRNILPGDELPGTLQKLFETMEIDNEHLLWNCQSWTFDALRLLRLKDILTDEEYLGSLNALMPLQGIKGTNIMYRLDTLK
jgi:hypothetical protein